MSLALEPIAVEPIILDTNCDVSEPLLHIEGASSKLSLNFANKNG